MTDLTQIFGPEGPLARKLPGFEPRPGQARMAQLVLQALSDNETSLIEAGTGTGKTLAYLVPAILLGSRVVISTGTKTLQGQLVDKDIPGLRRAGFKFEYALMKGRGNYLCPQRLDHFLAEPLLDVAAEAKLVKPFASWAAKTKTGDRAELTDFPDNLRFWNQVCSTSNHCLGSTCSFFTTCFVARMRQAAARADLVIVNHHLYFADLSLRLTSPSGVIPEHKAVIFDEAHGLEEVATEHFGTMFSGLRLSELTRDLRSFLSALKLSPPTVIRAASALESRSKALFKLVDKLPGNDRFRLEDQQLDKLGKAAGQNVLDSLSALGDELRRAMPQTRPAELETIVRRGRELHADLCLILDSQDRERVRWVERRPRGSLLNASPIEVADQLRENLLSVGNGIVLTSATLTTGNNFGFLKQRLGIDYETLDLVIPPIFDFARQTRLYLPRDLPEPNDSQFVEALTTRLVEFLRATSGRALVLFTSYRNMLGVRERLPHDLPFRVLLQGEGTKNALLEQFRDDRSSVLLATASFWQGVDVVGESLSAVFIDKLPFASPGEPIIAARIEAARARQQDPFWTFQVPSAILALRQGLGRLIRSRDDRGVLAIADVRLHTRRYGRKIIAGLPPSPQVSEISPLREFLEQPLDPSATD
ncbi:MAG: ATP-dependent DNA helicase [Candidatus Alcyoniella australis]|nr:ATP-dependent DNA helicase [Candidatus Alcyoniella australis]